MFGYCYLTTNTINDIVYVGQKTGALKPRYLGSGLILIRALRKYGPQFFTSHVLEWADSQDALNTLEIDMIAIFKSYGCRLYNLDGGGKNAVKTPETRRKLSEARKGYKMPLKDRLHLSRVTKGAPQSPARIAAVKRAQLSRVGLKVPQEIVDKIKLALAKTTKNKGINCWRFGKKISKEEIARRTETRRINRIHKLSLQNASTASAKALPV